MITINDTTKNNKSQENSFQRRYTDEEIDNLIQEEKEWLATMEEERKKDEADPNITVKQSFLLSLQEENSSMKMQLKQYENFFRAMYDNMMEAQRRKEKEALKPIKTVGNIKIY